MALWAAMCGIFTIVATSFLGWIAIQVVGQGRKLVELEARINSQDSTCADRLEWMRTMDGKLDRVATNTAAIRLVLDPKFKGDV